MRSLFSAFFLLTYLAIAAFIVALVIHNTHLVSFDSLLWGTLEIPLYLAFGGSFFVGFFLSLIGLTLSRMRRKISSHL